MVINAGPLWFGVLLSNLSRLFRVFRRSCLQTPDQIQAGAKLFGLKTRSAKMALPSSFWLPLAGLLIVAPQPSSAASFFASATGYALTTSDQCPSKGSLFSATCDAAKTSDDTGEMKSGEIHVRADLASGDISVHAQSEAPLPTAQSGGEAQIADTLTFSNVTSGSTTTITMSGTLSATSNSDNGAGFAAGWLDIFDNGLLAGGVACSAPNASFGCGSKIGQTEVTLVGNAFFISSTVRIDQHPEILVEFVVYASSFLTSSADVTDPITIETPPGVTFTSASGVFLTDAGGAGSVPETSTWTMMLAGFASLAVLGRRVRRRAVPLG